MSRVLPKELRTRKLKSLPDELSKIAEELLADKFGIEEEVVPSVDDFFLDPTATTDRRRFGPDEFGRFVDVDESYVHDIERIRDRQRGYKEELHVEIRPWDRCRVASLRIREPRFDSLIDGLRRLDRENISRGNRKFVMAPGFWDYLRRDPQMHMNIQYADRMWREGEERFEAVIFGCKIIVHPGVMDCMLEATF